MFLDMMQLSEEELMGVIGNLNQQNGQTADWPNDLLNNDKGSGSSNAGAGSGGNNPYIPLGGIG